MASIVAPDWEDSSIIAWETPGYLRQASESTSTACPENGIYLSRQFADSNTTLASTPESKDIPKSDQSGAPEIDLTPLRTNTRRLWDEIHHTAKWGAIPGSLGMARLCLSDADRRVRDYFVYEACNAGCDVQIDQMGNIFAVVTGENNEIPPIGIGSHLDTQPAGGRFDGVLGVLGALEVIRTIKASGVKTYAPLAAINWTNEEGARFKPGCTGSAVWADHIPVSEAHSLYDPASNMTIKDELQRLGYLGRMSAHHAANPLSAHFELHIEQRPRLEDTGKKIGVVQSIQGIRWYEVCIHGERAHAGAAMQDRADALVTASKVVTFLEAEAAEAGALSTVGTLNLDAPSLNTVPGEARFTIDFRCPLESTLDTLETTTTKYLAGLVAENEGLEAEVKRIWRSPAVDMHPVAVSCVRKAAEKVVGNSTMDLCSLAGHDSALIAMRVPTSMIFVPSRDGISHSPLEYTSEEECGIGVQVLLDAVLEFDSTLRDSHDKSDA